MESVQIGKASRYSVAQWEAQKANVERLYVDQDKPLKEVIQILSQEFGFQASEKQLKSRLPKWGFDVKNLKGDTMKHLARVKAKRKLENKESSFRVCKKPVDDQKIERYLRRHDITDEDLLAMASPVNAPSPGYSVFTPQSIRSPTPEVSLNAALMQSPTSRLNFQGLSIKELRPMSPILSSQNDVFARRLQVASSQQSLTNRQIPSTIPSRERPPLTPLGNLLPHMREKQNLEDDACALQQQLERSFFEPTTPKIISPMDVDLVAMKARRLVMDEIVPGFFLKYDDLDGENVTMNRDQSTPLPKWPPGWSPNFLSKDPRCYDFDDDDVNSDMGQIMPAFRAQIEEDFPSFFSDDLRHYDLDEENPDTNLGQRNPPFTMRLDLPGINTIMKVEVRPKDFTLGAPNSIEERAPPPTPIEVTAHGTESRVSRIAEFHGRILGRYLERVMERARSRGRDKFESPMMRQVWYCHSCDHYYASDAQQCHAPGHVNACYICGLKIDADASVDTKPLCFMCEIVKRAREGRLDVPYDSESSHSRF